MVKLKLIRLYRDKDVPDHVLEEVNLVTEKICTNIENLGKKHHNNIILSALNRFHAAFIVSVVEKNSLKEAAQTEAVGLIKNIEHLSGEKIFTQK